MAVLERRAAAHETFLLKPGSSGIDSADAVEELGDT